MMDGSSLSWFSWWGAADWVVRGVFIVLLLGSLISWSIILFKAWQLRGVHRSEERLRREITRDMRGGDLAPLLDRSPLFTALGERLPVWSHPSGPPERRALEAEFSQFIRERRIFLENGLTFLASIGSSAPFIGLFGTVWGIMHALQGLDGQSALSMDLVAGPVSEALVATAVGLFTAIPAVMGYNMLVRRLRRLLSTVDGNALHIINRLLERPA